MLYILYATLTTVVLTIDDVLWKMIWDGSFIDGYNMRWVLVDGWQLQLFTYWLSLRS